MKDPIGDRMKDFYESRTKYKLQRRTNTIIRIDGKAFHTYTKGLNRPFDDGLIEDMNQTAKYLCENIQGAKMAYVQSDEISILLTDYDDLNTQAWFDNNIQKITSIAASLATAKFNQLRMARECDNTEDIFTSYNINWFKLAMFDARVFQIASQEEVVNYFIWRQKDAIRNSISSVAQYYFSSKELHGKKTNDMLNMLLEKNVNWEQDFNYRKRHGSAVKKITEIKSANVISYNENVEPNMNNVVKRTKWYIDEKTPEFLIDKNYIFQLFPK